MTKLQIRLNKHRRRQERKNLIKSKLAFIFPAWRRPCESHSGPETEIAATNSEQQEGTLESVTLPDKKKSGLVYRVWAVLGNITFIIILFVMATLVFSMVQSQLTGGPPSVAGYQMYVVQGGSMSPTFKSGSLAFLKPTDPESVDLGDIITYRSSEVGETFTTHRVVAVNREDSGLSFTTRGDANQVDDYMPVSPENLVGRITYTVPYAGYLMVFGQSKTGIVALVFIPGILIIIFELRNLLRLSAQWEKEKSREKNAKVDVLTKDA